MQTWGSLLTMGSSSVLAEWIFTVPLFPTVVEWPTDGDGVGEGEASPVGECV